MAGRRHSKNTKITVDGDDLSAYTNASDYEKTADDEDTTCYGASAHRYDPGLVDGTFKMSGFYENGATSPRATISALIGADAVTVLRQAEGTGTGKPQESFSLLFTKYAESNPVAGYITWAAEGKMCSVVTETTQS